jgi:hypothetical protein
VALAPIYIQKLWNTSRVSFIIAVGLGSAGLGQFVFGLYPSTGFGAKELSVLTLWQSISLGVGLIGGSPLNGVLFSELVLLKGNINDPQFVGLWKSLTRLCTVGLLCISIGLFASTHWLFNDDYLLVVLLVISLVVQLIGAVQRAVLAAQSQWWRFSSQFIVEGVGRIVVTTLVVRSSWSSLTLLVALNVLIQLISLLIPVINHQWRPQDHAPRTPLRVATQMFIPLWLAALAVQSLLSLAPFFSRTIGKAAPLQIAALGGLVQIVRIPVTFSSPITLPHLNRLGTFITDKALSVIPRLIRNICLVLVLIWGSYALCIGIGSQLINLDSVTYGSLITPQLMLAVSATSLTCPVAIFLHSSFLLLRRSREMITAWILAFTLYIATMTFMGDSATGAVSAIAVGAVSAICVFLVSLIRMFNSSKFSEGNFQPA